LQFGDGGTATSSTVPFFRPRPNTSQVFAYETLVASTLASIAIIAFNRHGFWDDYTDQPPDEINLFDEPDVPLDFFVNDSTVTKQIQVPCKEACIWLTWSDQDRVYMSNICPVITHFLTQFEKELLENLNILEFGWPVRTRKEAFSFLPRGGV
ncbi:hypothetical protein L218DRAFT_951845, partial [Marasmius fiardii PR-910]